MMIHRLILTKSNGETVTLEATRVGVAPAHADYDVSLIERDILRAQQRIQTVKIKDFPRAAGPEGLFAAILKQMSMRVAENAVDELGRPIEMPQPTQQDWANMSKQHAEQALFCAAKAGKFAPEIIEQAKAAEPTLFLEK
jgi:hypothetical protein